MKKKSLEWHTTYGDVSFKESIWRSPNKSYIRTFKDRIKVSPRGCSLALQRCMTDFGMEESFTHASFRLKEHYGIEIPISAIRNSTLTHSRAVFQEQAKKPKVRKLQGSGVKQIVTEIDGTMQPMVRIKEGEGDRRKRREVFWKETRLAASQSHGEVRTHYSVDCKDVDSAGEKWAQSAQKAGWGSESKIHIVGDGATWIEAQSKKQFGKQGAYLLDFYHVCEYLSDASKEFVEETKRKKWLKEQQNLLKNNEFEEVLMMLKTYMKENQPDCPVAKAHRYLANRKDQLDYKGALDKELPIGSGMIESSHRHVLQKRMKLSGSWWDAENAESMSEMRVLRSNGEWGSYWDQFEEKLAA